VETPTLFSDLETAKTVDNPSPTVGDDVTFTVTVTNKGNSLAPNAFVIDKLPGGLQYVSGNPSTGTYDPGTGRWSVADLAVGSTETLKIVAKVLTTDPDSTTNKISGSGSDNPDPTPCPPDCGSNSIVVLTPSPAPLPPAPQTAAKQPLAKTGADEAPIYACAGALLIAFGAAATRLAGSRRRRV